MRVLIVALAIASVGFPTCAGAPGIRNGQGDTVPVQAPTPKVPDGARKQAEDAINRDLGGENTATFRVVRALEAESIRHDPFARRVDGPVSVICGQYAPHAGKADGGGYTWFLVAIKRGQVLWTTRDVAGEFAEAYNSCKAAGLADQTAETGGFR